MAATSPEDAQGDVGPALEKQSPTRQITNPENEKTGADTDSVSDFKQDGVRHVEAITQVWTTKMLWTTFVLIWLVSFVLAFISSVSGALTPYVTSAFSSHGLLAIINIAARIIGGVVVLAIAKIIDIRGRLEGFVGAIVLCVLGLIIMAVSRNVQTYAAAQVFYWVGNVAIGFVLEVFVADITTLRNRMIMFALNSTPFLITTFAGPRVAELFYYKSNFRWAFGAFAIILIGFSLPVIIILFIYERKAKKVGLIREGSGRTTVQSLKYYFVQFDVIGMILISAGFTLLLLPFSLAPREAQGWASASIIVMIVLGVVSLAAFVAWEKFVAPVMFFPFELLKDRTVLGASLTYCIVFLTTFVWNGYYSSYLQVVYDLSITNANYVLNGYSLTSYFTGPFVALYIRWTGRVKYPALLAIPIYVLGTALIIYFRNPNAYIGYVAMCQILVGFAVGMLTTMSQLALMAVVGHQNVAVAIAIYGLFGSIGSSVGYAAAGAIWNNILPFKLLEFLPEDAKSQASEIFGDITKQLEYPIGHPIRDAVILAYADVARKQVIVGASLIPLVVVAVLVWKNINVKDTEKEEKETRGTLF